LASILHGPNIFTGSIRPKLEYFAGPWNDVVFYPISLHFFLENWDWKEVLKATILLFVFVFKRRK